MAARSFKDVAVESCYQMIIGLVAGAIFGGFYYIGVNAYEKYVDTQNKKIDEFLSDSEKRFK